MWGDGRKAPGSKWPPRHEAQLSRVWKWGRRGQGFGPQQNGPEQAFIGFRPSDLLSRVVFVLCDVQISHMLDLTRIHFFLSYFVPATHSSSPICDMEKLGFIFYKSGVSARIGSYCGSRRGKNGKSGRNATSLRAYHRECAHISLSGPPKE